MELLRTEASSAFTYGECPEKGLQVGFIDGQIKLMKAESIQTWADFLYSGFTATIMRHFEVYGCRTVVLAFDDKRYVPKAKAITQSKRREGVQIIQFGEGDVLPNEVPQLWKESIMNAWFKHRVIELVCANVPRLVTLPDGCTLIVDWETTTEYVYRSGHDAEVREMESAPIGEADLKVTRWMRKFSKSMLVEATDGDYIPITLGLKVAGWNEPVVILKSWNAIKGPEFVSIDSIHSFLIKRFRRAGGGGTTDGWEIKLFILLLGLSGTDFTRNLPLVSPQKMWSSLPLIAQTFAMDGETTVDIAQGKRIVELLYAEAFPKHIDPYIRRSVWSQAQASKLGARNKALIPTDARIICTLRNVNFLFAYWLTFEPPRQIEGFGFRIDANGQVQWDE